MASSAASLFDVTPPTAPEMARAMQAFGMSQSDLLNEANRAKLVRGALILQRADRVRKLCAELGIQISDHSILNIATTLNVNASAESPAGNPLSPGDRQVAEELVYQYMKAIGPGRDDASARNSAKQRVKFGERGRTVLHSIGETFFGFGR